MPKYQTYCLMIITNAQTKILKIALQIYKKTFDRTISNHIFMYLILKINSRINKYWHKKLDIILLLSGNAKKK